MLRPVGISLVVFAMVWYRVGHPRPGATWDEFQSEILAWIVGAVALYFTGMLLWAVGKGYRPLHGLLFAFLGPIGVLVLLIPTREG